MLRRNCLASGVAVVVLALGAGCTATLPDDPEERAEIEALNDPFEPTNRVVFDVNMALDDAVMTPVAESYRDNLPDWFREGLHNILSNLQEPYVAGNDLLQGNPHAAADALGRFFVNSTFGLLGAHDAVVESGGAKPHKTDLGITLAVWGFGDGPYLMLPFFGPSSLRDGAGKVGEYWASPTGAMFGAVGAGMVTDIQTGVDLVDTRALLLDPMNELRRTSLDEYAAIRSLYRQSRDAALAEARAGQLSSRAPAAGGPAATGSQTHAAASGTSGTPATAPAIAAPAAEPAQDDAANPASSRGRVDFLEHPSATPAQSGTPLPAKKH